MEVGMPCSAGIKWTFPDEDNVFVWCISALASFQKRWCPLNKKYYDDDIYYCINTCTSRIISRNDNYSLFMVVLVLLDWVEVLVAVEVVTVPVQSPVSPSSSLYYLYENPHTQRHMRFLCRRYRRFLRCSRCPCHIKHSVDRHAAFNLGAYVVFVVALSSLPQYDCPEDMDCPDTSCKGCNAGCPHCQFPVCVCGMRSCGDWWR